MSAGSIYLIARFDVKRMISGRLSLTIFKLDTFPIIVTLSETERAAASPNN
jgi:hypothetical protein